MRAQPLLVNNLANNLVHNRQEFVRQGHDHRDHRPSSNADRPNWNGRQQHLYLWTTHGNKAFNCRAGCRFNCPIGLAQPTTSSGAMMARYSNNKMCHTHTQSATQRSTVAASPHDVPTRCWATCAKYLCAAHITRSSVLVDRLVANYTGCGLSPASCCWRELPSWPLAYAVVGGSAAALSNRSRG